MQIILFHWVYWGRKQSSFKIHFRLSNINMGCDGLSWGDVTIPGLNIETLRFLKIRHIIHFLTGSYCVLGFDALSVIFFILYSI